MQLGVLLARLGVDDGDASALAALGDVVLYCQVESLGRRFGETPGEYVRNAARRFAACADHEAWLKVMRAVDSDRDPTAAALRCMCRWAIERDEDEAPGHGGIGPSAAARCGCAA